MTVTPIPYSDKAFETAALEWLIETNQVCTFYYFLSTVLTNIAANCSVQECGIQEDA